MIKKTLNVRVVGRFSCGALEGLLGLAIPFEPELSAVLQKELGGIVILVLQQFLTQSQGIAVALRLNKCIHQRARHA